MSLVNVGGGYDLCRSSLEIFLTTFDFLLPLSPSSLPFVLLPSRESAQIDADALLPPCPYYLASSVLFGQKHTLVVSILDTQDRNGYIAIFLVRGLFLTPLALQPNC